MFIKLYSKVNYLIFNDVIFNFKSNINDKGQGTITINDTSEQLKNINFLKNNKIMFFMVELLDRNFQVLNTYFIKNILEKEKKTELLICDFITLLENDTRVDFSKLTKERMQALQECNNPNEFLTFCFNEFLTSFKFAPFNLHLKPLNIGTIANKEIKDLGEYQGQVVIVDFLKYIKVYLNYFNLVLKTDVKKDLNNVFYINYIIEKEKAESVEFLSVKNCLNVETRPATTNHALASIKYNNFFDTLELQEINLNEYEALENKKSVLVNYNKNYKKSLLENAQENQGIKTYERVQEWVELRSTNLSLEEAKMQGAFSVSYIKKNNQTKQKLTQLVAQEGGAFFYIKENNKKLTEFLNPESSFVILIVYEIDLWTTDYEYVGVYKLYKRERNANKKYYKVVKVQDYKPRPQLDEIHYYLTDKNEIIKRNDNTQKIDGVQYPLKTIIKEESFLAEAQIKALYELYKNRYFLGASFTHKNKLKIGDRVLFLYNLISYNLPITEIETKTQDNELITIYTIGNKRELLTQKIKDFNNKIIKNSTATNEAEQNNKLIIELKKQEKQNTETIKNLTTQNTQFNAQINATNNLVNSNTQKIKTLENKANNSVTRDVKEYKLFKALKYGEKINIYESNKTIKPEKVVSAFLEIQVGEVGTSSSTVKSANNKFITPIIITKDTLTRHYIVGIENGDGYFSQALLEVNQYTQAKANDIYVTLRRCERTYNNAENRMGKWSCNFFIYYTD